MRDRVEFRLATETADGYGGTREVWPANPDFTAPAEIVFQKGQEEFEAARRDGRARRKMRLLSTTTTRAITTKWRATDALRGTVYNILAVDVVTDRRWIYIDVESTGDQP